MTKKKINMKRAIALRKCDVKKINSIKNELSKMENIDVAGLIHELRVHQIELEMQNEELRRAQREVEESRSRYTDLYDFSPVGYITLDKRGIIKEANLTTAVILKMDRSYLVGRPLSAFINSDDLNEFYIHLKDIFGESRKRTCEIRFKKGDGVELYVKLESIAKEDQDMRKKLCRTSISDITDQKLIEEGLLKTKKLESLSILAGGIAHDFNNILTGIMGNISMSLLSINEDNKIHELLIEAQKEVLRAKHLTGQLLTFSKGGEPIKEAVPISVLINEAAKFVLRGSNSGCDFSLPRDLWPIEADRGQISQVIHNMLINAVQSMPEGGMIHIGAQNYTAGPGNKEYLKPGKYVQIIIKDHGAGIDKNIIPRIFDPYFTTKEKGTGLGLATAYSIINKHGGTITAESRPGIGSVFKIYIPVSLNKDLKEVPDDNSLYPGRGSILVMDDQEVIRDITVKLLVSLGYKADTAKDGKEAIKLYKRAMASGCPYTAVIIDLTIPGGMGGKEAMEALLKIDPDVKAIVSSGYSNDPIMANYKDFGFMGVLEKPYKIEKLSSVLHNTIMETPD